MRTGEHAGRSGSKTPHLFRRRISRWAGRFHLQATSVMQTAVKNRLAQDCACLDLFKMRKSNFNNDFE
ncbi:hypothetical protein VTO73DRAFT_4724 [Trametes versicolor]